jgi:alanine racemase
LNTLHLYLSRLDHNYSILRKQIKPSTHCYGVVKANAYGSHAIHIAKRLVKLGVNKIAVAYTEEGIALRNQGIKIPIMVFYPQPYSIPELLEAQLEPCIYSHELLDEFEFQLKTRGLKNYPIHIKYNTGLNRVGFPLSAGTFLLKKIKPPLYRLESVYSHLAASEEARPSDQCNRQIERFQKLIEHYKKEVPFPPKFHLLNSSGVFNYPEYQYDAVRCGIAFHGYANNPKWDALLKPIAELKSIICQIHQVEKDEAVGYDNGWIAPKIVQIATLPIGHADGIGRHFGNHRCAVLIKGQRAPIVGNVCMDMLMVDVTGISCKTGDEAVLFDRVNPADSFAQNGKSISYELLCGLGPRIQRIVHP